VIDPRLEGQNSHSRAHAEAALASQCSSVEPRIKPNMDEVVKTMEQLQESKDTENKGYDHHVRNSSMHHPQCIFLS